MLAGVELMAIILKQKRLARQGALKALDFATTRYAPACERLINMAGLKVFTCSAMLQVAVASPCLQQRCRSIPCTA